jgi:hypothetical protein
LLAWNTLRGVILMDVKAEIRTVKKNDALLKAALLRDTGK